MNASPASIRVATSFAIALTIASSVGAASCAPNAPCSGNAVAVYANPESEEPSWIFRQSTYTHDPETGARVAQYSRPEPVEPLPDQRLVTSRYRRSRSNLRGADGSYDTTYEVQAWGNGRGGIDAEWERFHDAWKESYLQGGSFNQSPGNFGPWNGGGKWKHGGPWGGGYGPGYGYGPGHGGGGYPGYGGGYPGNGGPW